MPMFVLFLTVLQVSAAQAGVQDLHLSYETVSRLAGLPLHCYNTEFPNKLNQVLSDDSELLSPSELHPIFYGCFDWHSSVHGHWLLARAAQLFPNTQLAQNITAVFNAQFTVDKVEKELAYFKKHKANKSFERTYGWAWLLKLQEELVKLNTDWSEILEPLVQHIVTSWTDFQPKLVYPIRVGEHKNTAFGLSFAMDYCRNVGENEGLADMIRQNSTVFYQTDKNCPIGYEPSGFDFLSPCLEEAEFMVKIIESEEDFTVWLQEFLPQLFDPDFSLAVGEVRDNTDGKLVHLDGLNFSRAWCLYNIAAKLLTTEPAGAARLVEMADIHVRASLDSVVGSDYAGSHWLASFLLHALQTRQQTLSLINHSPEN